LIGRTTPSAKHARLEILERILRLPFEDVVGDPVGLAQLRPVDPVECGEIGLRSRPLGVEIGVGDEVAEPVGVAQVAAEDGADRIALEVGLVALVEQPRQPLAFGLRRGRSGGGGAAGLGGERSGDGASEMAASRKNEDLMGASPGWSCVVSLIRLVRRPQAADLAQCGPVLFQGRGPLVPGDLHAMVGIPAPGPLAIPFGDDIFDSALDRAAGVERLQGLGSPYWSRLFHSRRLPVRGVTRTLALGKKVWPPASGSLRKIIAVQVRWPPCFSISGQ
jgi:hypothetical protein